MVHPQKLQFTDPGVNVTAYITTMRKADGTVLTVARIPIALTGAGPTREVDLATHGMFPVSGPYGSPVPMDSLVEIIVESVNDAGDTSPVTVAPSFAFHVTDHELAAPQNAVEG